IISQTAARDVKGVLSGVGGDEWFSGYSVTRRMARYATTPLGRAQTIAGQLAHLLGGMVPAGNLRNRIDNLATRRSLLSTCNQTHSVFTHQAARQMVGLEDNHLSAEA